ncbi:uncharacterized protein N7473_007380 [Penicillium subrubescens]|nr:uncharacterized protein N7473_007380 [Penicillium subrubescens]KAJ5891152.1 hypothetical protein N7473_007380 [Penicillium subrubescens]
MASRTGQTPNLTFSSSSCTNDSPANTESTSHSHYSITMSLLGKKFPGALAGPMTPFFAAGLIVLYGVNSLQNALSNTAEFKNDPRNPNAKAGNSH